MCIRDRASLAAHGATMVIFLSIGLIDKVQTALLQGAYSPDTPAAVVYLSLIHILADKGAQLPRSDMQAKVLHGGFAAVGFGQMFYL